jgi:uncharacterized protein (TIGR00290 family)
MTVDATSPAAWSTSGGKDSMLALLRAREAGVEVGTMLTMCDETGLRNRSHGIPRAILEAQAAALNMQLMMPSASWTDYEAVFVASLESLAARGVRRMVFGDIDLQAHRDWEEGVCARAGLEPLLPLWGGERTRLAHEVLERRIRAVVVCVDSRFLDDSFCGREFDAAFLADLPAGVCPCGENGEFHTFVFDAPAMRAALPVGVKGRHAYVSPPQFGSQRYCFADLELRG